MPSRLFRTIVVFSVGVVASGAAGCGGGPQGDPEPNRGADDAGEAALQGGDGGANADMPEGADMLDDAQVDVDVGWAPTK